MLSEAHAVLGSVALQTDFAWADSERELRSAIALNPNNSTAHLWLGYLLEALQRFEEAKDEFRTAMELDPYWDVPRNNLLNILAKTGDYEPAITLAREGIQREPEQRWRHVALANAYLFAGRSKDARRELDLASGPLGRGSPFPRAVHLARLGDLSEVRELLDRWRGNPQDPAAAPRRVAGLLAILGETEEALTLLERDMHEGGRTFWSLYQQPYYDPIRDEPRFKALLEAIHLPTTVSWHLGFPQGSRGTG